MYAGVPGMALEEFQTKYEEELMQFIRTILAECFKALMAFVFRIDILEQQDEEGSAVPPPEVIPHHFHT